MDDAVQKIVIDFDPPKEITDELRVDHGPLPSEDRIYQFYGPEGESLVGGITMMTFADHIIIGPAASSMTLAKVVIIA